MIDFIVVVFVIIVLVFHPVTSPKPHILQFEKLVRKEAFKETGTKVNKPENHPSQMGDVGNVSPGAGKRKIKGQKAIN